VAPGPEEDYLQSNHQYATQVRDHGQKPDIRERIEAAGAPAVSDQDLLAAILGTGSRTKSVHSLAAEILQQHNLGAAIPGTAELTTIDGLGSAGACRVIAALELGRRFYGHRERHIQNPADAWQLLQHYADRKREHFICCTLNGAHDVIAVHVITSGLINRTIIHPREIYAEAVADRSCAILVAHNHPSGRLEASSEDIDITRRVQEAGEIIGIPLIDHIIFSESGYISLVEQGYLKAGKI